MIENVTFEVTFSGELFDRGVYVPRIEASINNTLDYGVDIIKERTPVITGLLASQWEHDRESIFNDVFYTGFVEKGTRYFVGRFMVERSLNEIRQKFIENVTQYLP